MTNGFKDSYKMYRNEEKKRTLIKLINRYLNKPHIQSRYLFQFYKERLLDNKYLTEKQFNHLSKYLVHDMDMTSIQVRKYFDDLIDNGKNSIPKKEPSHFDLSIFMV